MKQLSIDGQPIANISEEVARCLIQMAQASDGKGSLSMEICVSSDVRDRSPCGVSREFVQDTKTVRATIIIEYRCKGPIGIVHSPG